jgi:hypothetical protein
MHCISSFQDAPGVIVTLLGFRWAFAVVHVAQIDALNQLPSLGARLTERIFSPFECSSTARGAQD